MAGERTVPGPLAVVSFWNTGSAYKAQMDENLRRLGIFCQGVVDSQVAAAPGSPTNGDVHIATADWGVALEGGATSNSVGDLIVRDNGAWVAYTPWAGLSLWQVDTAMRIEWNGSSWSSTQTGLFKGYHVDAAALASAHPSPEDGSHAYVDAGVGQDPEFYVWDTDDNAWKLAGGAGGGGGSSQDGIFAARSIKRAEVSITTTTGAINASAGYFVSNWDEEIVDVGDWWDSGASDRVTVPAGVSQVRVGVFIEATNVDANQNVTVSFEKNGSGSFIYVKDMARSDNDALSVRGSVQSPVLDVQPGDYFRVCVAAGEPSINLHERSTFYIEEVPKVAGPSAPGAQYAVLRKSGDDTNQDGTAGFLVEWDSEDASNISVYSGVNPTRITVPEGVTKVSLMAQIWVGGFEANASLNIEVRLNGSTLQDPWIQTNFSTESGFWIADISSPILSVTPGDYFEFRVTTAFASDNTVDLRERSWAQLKVEESTAVNQFAGVSLYRNSDVSSLGTSGYTVPWQATDYDTHGFWAASPNPSRITIPPGVKKVELAAGLETINNSGAVLMEIQKNGSNAYRGFGRTIVDSSSYNGQDVKGTANTGVVDVVEGDYFEFRIFSTDSDWILDATASYFQLKVVE